MQHGDWITFLRSQSWLTEIALGQTVKAIPLLRKTVVAESVHGTHVSESQRNEDTANKTRNLGIQSRKTPSLSDRPAGQVFVSNQPALPAPSTSAGAQPGGPQSTESSGSSTQEYDNPSGARTAQGGGEQSATKGDTMQTMSAPTTKEWYPVEAECVFAGQCRFSTNVPWDVASQGHHLAQKSNTMEGENVAPSNGGGELHRQRDPPEKLEITHPRIAPAPREGANHTEQDHTDGTTEGTRKRKRHEEEEEEGGQGIPGPSMNLPNLALEHEVETSVGDSRLSKRPRNLVEPPLEESTTSGPNANATDKAPVKNTASTPTPGSSTLLTGARPQWLTFADSTGSENTSQLFLRLYTSYHPEPPHQPTLIALFQRTRSDPSKRQTPPVYFLVHQPSIKRLVLPTDEPKPWSATASMVIDNVVWNVFCPEDVAAPRKTQEDNSKNVAPKQKQKSRAKEDAQERYDGKSTRTGEGADGPNLEPRVSKNTKKWTRKTSSLRSLFSNLFAHLNVPRTPPPPPTNLTEGSIPVPTLGGRKIQLRKTKTGVSAGGYSLTSSPVTASRNKIATGKETRGFSKGSTGSVQDVASKLGLKDAGKPRRGTSGQASPRPPPPPPTKDATLSDLENYITTSLLSIVSRFGDVQSSQKSNGGQSSQSSLLSEALGNIPVPERQPVVVGSAERDIENTPPPGSVSRPQTSPKGKDARMARLNDYVYPELTAVVQELKSWLDKNQTTAG
ncbi:hypothetical protein M427DRAFT_28833 [Gonapodya prolifera JEL478]|uniref:Uncharacterized protein n=1 Tax=Gonapodya prolifera (strain JEL478) TaxID=1344416 RepID=A0A139ATG0_GONPJ|nr:hypothetical protein M427DRAFT_28833 [Gonapodya prolifera JEL478]|eukprot:KXS19974.1 hypothetical protein M427DRAFT_28833 [Gonapodya prolifera JEL478]